MDESIENWLYDVQLCILFLAFAQWIPFTWAERASSTITHYTYNIQESEIRKV